MIIEHPGGESFGTARSAMPLSPAVRAGDFVFISGGFGARRPIGAPLSL
jgi:hypothetical protein